ncbi:MAG: quinohemoprotein amine dehydrogenase subunit alpha [Emcibacter sp.]|nr:quinohemoprotein amine dehydrogenase subunit alpha [Emcibacter sp.]
MSGKMRLFISGIMLLALSTLSTPALADSAKGKALVNDYCTACHAQGENGKLARISDVRKTPEGWEMTIFRMQHLHGLEVDGDERLALIKYLSAEYGLAPSEAAPFRYVLEQRSYFVDHAPNDDLDALCGRCHTNARYGLQRRTEQDWLKHMHFHVGQFPSLEYQARSRDRFWWKEVTTKTYKELGQLYPLQTPEWDKWKASEANDPTGQWRVVGHRPGLGGYEGTMTISRDGDYFKATYNLQDLNGSPLSGDSKAVIYTGYEWRGSGLLNDTETREVYAISEDGRRITGRWYESAHYDIGGEFQAVLIEGAEAQVLLKSSDYIRIGNSKEITFHGVGLTGKVSTNKGLDINVIAQNDTSVTVKITAAKNMSPGAYKVTVGQAVAEIIVYDHINSVQVSPAWTIARLGGGHTPPVTAQFEAVAYMKGKDGDVKIGIMPAQWQALAFNEEAEHMKDVDFAGQLNQQGQFMPASAGPNPKRKYATNNAGNLKIVALIKEDGKEITGKAQLIVTVQRWNKPPIR